MMAIPRKPAVAGLFGLAVAIAGWIIAPSEGNSPVGYADVGGVPTVCLGHTGSGVVVGQRYSEEQCQAWFTSDVGMAARGVQSCIHAPMTSYQWGAFTSTAFNIGVGQFCRSSIATRANAGDMPGACAAISLYVYAAGQPQPGLIRRRASERALCDGHT